MALTLSERITIAYFESTPFRNQVLGALVKHSKYVLRTEQSSASQSLARAVLRTPDSYVTCVGAALLTEPVYDELTDETSLTDVQVQDTVAELWPLFVPAE